MAKHTDFAACLRKLRESADLSQNQLAAKAGVNQATIVRLEQGQKPGWETVQRLADALGISTEVFR